ncbi:hypothetical protein [Deinococcus wulumuqiensis]|uniref:Uncharacterized protein n=1 Tax=Deinococcus wulumuqiensis TaxID=980427 RepID=A0AAV4K9U9_9DEIO|nr:hypothetical protein [Deinococcus wulumuqiensis]QII20037.1 DUF2089 domain-containing protein [Deinococcus wulumuqiensis R12]GGI87130.1 hypothetical protein GCM10010914_22000 [Deinococcus wulumuqiensis]GGP29973.1 hypothetical protein GCM10008021_16240 [Deinococcus wulumuqiensis]
MAYSDEQREAFLTILEANAGNIKKTARETGVSAPTLREWQAQGKIKPSPEKVAEIIEGYLEKAKRVREKLLDRMSEVADTEKDLFKLSGAFKIVADATADEEVNRALANRINAAQAQATAGTETPRIAGSADPAFN